MLALTAAGHLHSDPTFTEDNKLMKFKIIHKQYKLDKQKDVIVHCVTRVTKEVLSIKKGDYLYVEGTININTCGFDFYVSLIKTFSDNTILNKKAIIKIPQICTKELKTLKEQ